MTHSLPRRVRAVSETPRRGVALAAAVAAALIAGVAQAEPRTDRDLLRAVWADAESVSGAYSDAFLRQLPAARLKGIMDGLNERCGALVDVEKGAKPGRFVLTTVHCEIPTTLRRDREGRIVGLWFANPARRGVSLKHALDAIGRFDGKVSWTVLRDGKLISGRDRDEPLAVGSAFKLVVLAALLERIEVGAVRWSDTMSLASGDISLPTGRLRTMPPGSPLTLHTLAAFMISESDNTAADALMRFVGRARLETLSGVAPFLTTREFFLLKTDEALYRRYAAADTAGRRALLGTLPDRTLPRVEDVLRPHRRHAEWRLSTADLCAWMAKVVHLPLMRMNPGPVWQSRWKRIAYKGGSEIGVLNLTTRALDPKGRDVCVSVTWNAPRPLQEGALAERYVSLFLSLAREP